LAHQQTSNDYDKLKQEEADKSARLQELMYVDTTKQNKLTNDFINTQLATPKKLVTTKQQTRKAISHVLPQPRPQRDSKSRILNSDERQIENICDYFDELQYHCEFFPSSLDNKSSKNLYQYSQLTKLRKNILNRKLIEHRQRVKTQKHDKSIISSLTSVVDSMKIPSLHFHLILSLTMVLLTHQCPQYLIVY
jgi:hypothetical protein